MDKPVLISGKDLQFSYHCGCGAILFSVDKVKMIDRLVEHWAELPDCKPKS